MAKVVGLGHASFTVMDMDRTVDFYVNKLGGKLLTETVDQGPELGTYVMGEGAQKFAALKVAMVELGGIQIEFLQYLDPKTDKPYHGNPSVAGSGHLAFNVDDLEAMYQKLKAEGVTFHSSVNECVRDGVLVWKWVYMRDPDGICCELVQLC
ncbi:MAG: VOC family protein [Christensenellales bacterium]|jgi:glyoxylase I family protein